MQEAVLVSAVRTLTGKFLGSLKELSATQLGAVIVAGGRKSMSNCPYLLDRAREGLRMGHGQVTDSMISDGLWCSFEQCHMGNAGEVVAREYHIDRECQDRYAVESHRRAATAIAEGRFKAEILSVSIPQKKGPAVVVDRDESVRPDATMETLG